MKLRLGFVSNSSSEAFLISGSKTPEEIEKDLHTILAAYNTVTGRSLAFGSVFESPRYASQGDYAHLADYCGESWIKGELAKAAANPKTVIVYSFGDNSIPSGIIEFIEDVYEDVERIHLG